MQKIEAEKLLTTILFEPQTPRTTIILSDELIFQKCVEDTIIKKTQKRPKIFTGTQGFSQYNQHVKQNDLFEPISDCIIILDENFTIKKEREQKNSSLETKEDTSPYGLKPLAHQNRVFIFGKTILRHLISEKNFPSSLFYLCYAPNPAECQRCAEILAAEYLSPQKYPAEELSRMAFQALLHYNNDLYHCTLHFERMRKGKLNFNDAFLDSPLSAFDIVQTLLEGNLVLLDTRLFQYAQNGGETSHILRAMVYFFKQLALVHAELANNPNLNQALTKAKIPYPAQNKIKKAIQTIPYAKIEHFFSILAQLELNLRESRNPDQVLFLEAMSLVRAVTQKVWTQQIPN